MKHPADFRSDTVTLPTEAMRRAMMEAPVGDDVLDGDPTVAELERHAASWLGKEGALFVPSGTMANQVALGAWTRPGQEALVGSHAHLLLFEAGALAALHGIQTVTLPDDDGCLHVSDVEKALRPDSIHCPDTALICVEQTHMASGGRVAPLERMQALSAKAAELGLPVHMDGARLGNAVVASGIAAETWAACADSVSICLSKGLGAPVGSLVAGPEPFLERARVVRKRQGGWMRQAGILAAAGLLALTDGIDHLAADHALARRLAGMIGGPEEGQVGLEVDVEAIETNLVPVRVTDSRWTAPALAERLDQEGVRVLALAPDTLRFVTHRDVDGDSVTRVQEALGRVLGSGQA